MSGLFSKFATVGGASMTSRLLGFVRETLLAATLGTGPVADVFYTCFRFPNQFRRLFAEGAFNIAFIPLFAKELEGGGEEAARKFSQEVFAVLASWLLLFTAVAIPLMPFLVATIVAPGFTDTLEKFELSVSMTRIMFPYLLCMSLVAMFSGDTKFAEAVFSGRHCTGTAQHHPHHRAGHCHHLRPARPAGRLVFGRRCSGLGFFATCFTCLGGMAGRDGFSPGLTETDRSRAAPAGTHGAGLANGRGFANQSSDRHHYSHRAGRSQRTAQLC